jgi:hypothetical protein
MGKDPIRQALSGRQSAAGTTGPISEREKRRRERRLTAMGERGGGLGLGRLGQWADWRKRDRARERQGHVENYLPAYLRQRRSFPADFLWCYYSGHARRGGVQLRRGTPTRGGWRVGMTCEVCSSPSRQFGQSDAAISWKNQSKRWKMGITH